MVEFDNCLWCDHLIDGYLEKSSIQGFNSDWFCLQSLLKGDIACINEIMSTTSLSILSNLRLLSNLILYKSNNEVSCVLLVLLVALSFESKLGADLHTRLNDDCFKTGVAILSQSMSIEGECLSLVSHILDGTMIELHYRAWEVNFYVLGILGSRFMASTIC